MSWMPSLLEPPVCHTCGFQRGTQVCRARQTSSERCLASLGERLSANLHADLCFGAIRPLEDKRVFAQESRAWLPVENATLETRSDWQRDGLAVDQLVTPDC